MGQELHVLKCFSCETFQSHIVKKTNKWECKVCGAKQSIKKVYGRGSGKECRLHTQKLNNLKCENEDTKLIRKVNELECDTSSGQSDHNIQLALRSTEVKVDSLKLNKWASYLNHDMSDVNKENPPTQEKTMCSHDIEVKSNTVLKRKRKHDMHESYTNNEHMGSVECSDFDKDNLSVVYSPESFSSKEKKYDKRNFTENVNDHKRFNVNYIDEISEKNKVLLPSFGRRKEASTGKQQMVNEKNFKWAKYLVDEPKEEESSDYQYEAVSPISTDSNAHLNTNENICNSPLHSDRGISNYERARDFPCKASDSMLKYSDQCSSLKNNHNSDVLSKGTNSTLHAENSFEEHGNKLHQILMSRDLPRVKAPPLTSLPIFEQSCDLNNSDFQLDF